MSEKLTGGVRGNFPNILPDSGLVLDASGISSSVVFDIQKNGISLFNIKNDGSFAITFGRTTDLAGMMNNAAASGFHLGNSVQMPFIQGTGAGTGGITQRGDSGYFAFSNGSNAAGTRDVLLTRKGPATLRFGAADAASPIAQTLSVQSVVAGTTNTAGANLTITGSQGTGTGAGGSILFQVALSGSANTFTVTFTNASSTIAGTGLPTTAGTPVAFTTTGALPTNFAINTTYYVLAGSTSTAMTVGATAGGTAIVAGSAGSGTHTLSQAVAQNNLATALTIASDKNAAFGYSVATRTIVGDYGTNTGGLQINGNAVLTMENGQSKFSGNLSIGGVGDVWFVRDAANTLALRNGTNAQGYRLYNTYTDGSNYERGVFDWTTTANTLTIGTQNAGTGTARNLSLASATGSITVPAGTVTTSQPIFDMSQTWNNAATTFTGLKLNVTDTASVATSLLMDLQVGGSSKFKVDKAGAASAVSLTLSGSAVTTINSGTSPTWGNANFAFLNNGVWAGAGTTSPALAAVSSNNGTMYWQLWADGQNVLSQRVTTSAQTHRVYNTFTDASNGEWGTFDWTTTANTLTIGTKANGTGTARNLSLASATGSITVPAGTVTTSRPVLDMSQTWNASGTTFTGLKLNVTDTASNAASLLMDLQVGGSTQASIDKTGALTLNGPSSQYATIRSTAPFRNATLLLGFNLNGGPGTAFADAAGTSAWCGASPVGFINTSVCAYTWTGGSLSGTPDLILTRKAAATLQHGGADAAAPIAQTIGVQSVIAGTTDTAGANFTINGSQGTGTGIGGSIVFRTAPAAASTATTQNALVAALTIGTTSITIANTIALVANGSSGTAGQTLASNGTGIYWTSAGGIDQTAAYVWTGTHSFSKPVTFSNNLLANTVNAASVSIGVGGTVVANTLGIYSTGTNGVSGSILTTITGSFVANATSVTIAATAGLYANGSLGTAGQLLTSNGSAAAWVTPAAAVVDTAAQYTWTNNHTFTYPVTFSNTLLANTVNAASISVGVGGIVIANTLGVYSTGTISTATLSTSGNVGIGTSGIPTNARLQVNGAIQSANIILNAQTANYTLTANDSGATILVTNTSSSNVYIPTGLPTGFRCIVSRLGNGTLLVSNQAGISAGSRTGATSVLTQYGSVSVLMTNSTFALLDGNL